MKKSAGQIGVIDVSRLATSTVYKLVFIGTYIAALLLGLVDIILDVTGVPADVVSVAFDVNIAGLSLASGILGLILLPLSAALYAAMVTLLLGSAIALGLYIWSHFESMTIRYVVISKPDAVQPDSRVEEQSVNAP